MKHYKVILKSISLAVALLVATPSFARQEAPELNLFEDSRYHDIMDNFAEKIEISKRGYYQSMVKDFKVDIAEVINVLFIISEFKDKNNIPLESLKRYHIEYPSEKILLEVLVSVMHDLKKTARNPLYSQFGNVELPLAMIKSLSDTVAENANRLNIRDVRIRNILAQGFKDALLGVVNGVGSLKTPEWNRVHVKSYAQVEESILRMSTILTPPGLLERLKFKMPEFINRRSPTVPQAQPAVVCVRLFV